MALTRYAAGSDHDTMKGALYVLGSKMFQNLSILDWRYGPKYIMGESNYWFPLTSGLTMFRSPAPLLSPGATISTESRQDDHA